MAFRAAISLQLEIQSHHIFSVKTFKVVLLSLAFRAMFSVWHSEPISNLAFRVTIPSQFGVQSHHPIMIGHSLLLFRRFRATFLAFRAISLVWSFRASFLVFNVISFFSLVFRATYVFLVTMFKVIVSV